MKRLESKLRKKYVFNLLNKPQRLAEIKTPKFLTFLSKSVTNLKYTENNKKTQKKTTWNLKTKEIFYTFFHSGEDTRSRKEENGILEKADSGET